MNTFTLVIQCRKEGDEKVTRGQASSSLNENELTYLRGVSIIHHLPRQQDSALSTLSFAKAVGFCVVYTMDSS
jgi:hypothetical protein